MKSILMSIKPEWCERIANGNKTIEVRKTRPKIETPFKVYIYCGQSELLTKSHCTGKIYIASNKKYKNALEKNGNITLSGKIIGDFTCDEISCADVCLENKTGWFVDNMHALEGSCLAEGDILSYCPIEKEIYGLHISDLKIYDKPKELSEFRNPCQVYINGTGKCGDCDYYYCTNNESYREEICVVDGLKPITRPPQSWCYVEGLEDKKG